LAGAAIPPLILPEVTGDNLGETTTPTIQAEPVETRTGNTYTLGDNAPHPERSEGLRNHPRPYGHARNIGERKQIDRRYIDNERLYKCE
jgi:hypothetical protein